eukprot:1599210-Pyramimonas_sp.AAC.1
MNANDPIVKANVENARAARLTGKGKPVDDVSVASDVTHKLRTMRSFVCASDKELRQAAKEKTELAKSMTSHIPRVTVPSERGPSKLESVMCFKGDSQPFRTLQ